MLKACWDCIAGDQQRREDGLDHTVHLNGRTQIPPGQSFSDGNMFQSPPLRQDNEVIIEGEMTEDRTLNLTVYGSDTKICQINVSNRQSNENFLHISQGSETVLTRLASSSFNDGTHYIFRFVMTEMGMEINAGIDSKYDDQYLTDVELDVNDIKMFTVDGTVEKLTYIFKKN